MERVAVVLPLDRRAALAISLGINEKAGAGWPVEIETMLSDSERADREFGRLFAAFDVTGIAAAAWLQFLLGRTALLNGPRFCDGHEWQPDVAKSLVEQCLAGLSPCDATQVQSLVDSDAGATADVLRDARFTHLTDLLYLVSPQENWPDARPACPLILTPFSNEQRERLERLVERTYIGSRDCPQLDGRRDVREVVDGYAATGRFDPGLWLIASHAGQDVGCLLLTDHPEHDQWELIYVGLVPEARGRGWGLELTRQAQWRARQAGRSRLVLAVDAANEPALRMYAPAGFTLWDRRSVFVRFYQ